MMWFRSTWRLTNNFHFWIIKFCLYTNFETINWKSYLVFSIFGVVNKTLRLKYWWQIVREACRKKTSKFMTICQRVGRWQTQNMISFLKEIMTRGLVPESLVRKLKPWKIHFLLKNTKPNPQLLHLHLYFCPCHQRFIVLCVCF